MRLDEAGRRAGTFPLPTRAQEGLCLGPSTSRQGSWVLTGHLQAHPRSLGLEVQPRWGKLYPSYAQHTMPSAWCVEKNPKDSGQSWASLLGH